MNDQTYVVRITLTTEAGDLPDFAEVESLIASQMAGELDDPAEAGGTGLACIRVEVIGTYTL